MLVAMLVAMSLIATRNLLIRTTFRYLQIVRMCLPLFTVLRRVFYKPQAIVIDTILWLSRLSVFSLVPTMRESRESI